MHLPLFKALRSIRVSDEAATAVVTEFQSYVEGVVNNNIAAVRGELAEFRGELTALRGEFKGMAAGIDALKHQVTLMGVLLSIIGLAIAAGPIVAKFIH
jgi:hypothetical protein